MNSHIAGHHITEELYSSMRTRIYRGIDAKDQSSVILKTSVDEFPTVQDIARLDYEYRITKRLEGDGITHAICQTKFGNRPAIIFEDFHGISLKDFLMQHECVELSDFPDMAIDIAEALGRIHQQHVIHKDNNPGNILINPDTKRIQIIDFGIATELSREKQDVNATHHTEGSLAYISPEQTGRMNRELDYRTDYYSLGVTLYELLTGTLPFHAEETIGWLHCHIAKTPSSINEVNSDIPLIVSDIVMKLLAKNAEDRYQSVLGLKADLEWCVKNLKGLKNPSIVSGQALSGFELGQYDFSGQFHIPQKLYGRDHEVHTLLQAFERVSSGQAEMMLVAGYSGVGKTALVHEVHKPMTEKHGYFIAGKFEQYQKHIPYYAVIQAFNQFCRYVLTEREGVLRNWQKRILDAVGNNGQIIIDVIPDLEFVIGKQPAVAEVDPTEAHNRFQMCFLNFVNTLCTQEHPLILFLDDLQWADLASLKLMTSIMHDDIKHLLIIGAYRNNEVDNSHPLILAVDELKNANAIINTIELANLQHTDMSQILQDSLMCGAVQTHSLTDLVYHKTGGNAFFIHQFLQTLYNKELLVFDVEQRTWQWDVEKIANQNFTANVIDLMSSKIAGLPENTSALLRLAACIGNQFDLHILAITYEQAPDETFSVLWNAIMIGLIQSLDEHYKSSDTVEQSQFTFLHDKVQQAVYALIDDEQKQSVHLRIGRLLLNNTPADELEERVFDIVGQFNRSLELLESDAEKLHVAGLNLEAGKKAKHSAAFEPAFNYVTIGLHLLTEERWQTDYALTLALHEEGAETAYLSGNYDDMNRLVDVVLRHAKTTLDTARIAEIRIHFFYTQQKGLEATAIGLKTLQKLGLNLTPNPGKAAVVIEMAKTKLALLGKDIEDLENLPEMTDPQQLAIIRILMVTAPATYLTTPELYPIMIFNMVRLSLTYGNSKFSCFAYASYGLILCGVLGEVDSGYRFGSLAESLVLHYDFNFWTNILDNMSAQNMSCSFFVSRIYTTFQERNRMSVPCQKRPLDRCFTTMR